MKFEYQISLGQDCSTLVLMGYTGIKSIPFVFDQFGLYSDDYLKLVSYHVTDLDKNWFQIFIKDQPDYLINLYHGIINNQAGLRIRINFQAFFGGKYDTVYIDNLHVDGNNILDNVDLSSFEAFMNSVQTNVFKFAEQRITQNINSLKNVYASYRGDKILFIRTLKHVVSKIEYQHLNILEKNLKSLFPNSKLLLITDNMKTSQMYPNIIYFKFDRWYPCADDNNRFRLLLSSKGIEL